MSTAGSSWLPSVGDIVAELLVKQGETMEPDTGRTEPLEHLLYRAMTRPALVMGIPVEAVAICGAGGQLMALATGRQWMMMAAGGVLWAAAAAVSLHDPLIFRVLLGWLKTRPAHPDLGRASRRYWGGISASTLRVARRYTVEELGRHAGA